MMLQRVVAESDVRLLRPAMLSLLLFIWLFSAAVKGSLQPHRTRYACENSTLRLHCDPGQSIQLVRANFGRFSITICNKHGNTQWSVRCMAPRAIGVLFDRCDHKQNCSVEASERVFGDPCPNTRKYLEAHYKCIPAVVDSASVKSPSSWQASVTTIPPSTTSTFKPPPPPHFVFTTTTRTTSVSTTKLTSTSSTSRSSSATALTSTVASKRSSSDEARSRAADSASAQHRHIVVSRPVPDRAFIETREHRHSQDGTQEDITDIRPAEEFFSNTSNNADHDEPNFYEESEDQSFQHAPTRAPPSFVDLPDDVRASLSSTHCQPVEARHVMWNWTAVGHTAVQPCPEGTRGAALWRCELVTDDGLDGMPRWHLDPDLSECRSRWLGQLEVQLKMRSNVLNVAAGLAEVTDANRLYGGDLNVAVRLINILPAQLSGGADRSLPPVPADPEQREAVVAELTKTVVRSTSNLLADRQRAMWYDLERPERMSVATSLLLGMEENAFLLAASLSEEKSVMQSGENVVMSVHLLNTDWTTGPANFPSVEERQLLTHVHDSISIPRESLLANAHGSRVMLVFLSYEGMESILNPDDTVIRNIGDNDSTGRVVVNSRIVSASLGKGRHVQLPSPATITLRHLRTENVTRPRCVFWDYTINQWSSQGCSVVLSNTTHTRCSCNHLTNFAVLMDIERVPLSISDERALQIITYAGCGVSIVCLALALATFHLFKGLKSDRTSIHKNLCFCLLVGEVIFLAGINQTEHAVICGIVAGLLHYFFLCAFAWMFFEGFQLYVMLIEVFETERSRIRWYYLLAYGIPAIIVAVSCIVDPRNYGTLEFCWLRTDNYFIFAFVGPVVIVILANLVFLGMAVVMMWRHSVATVTIKSKDQSRLSSANRRNESALSMKTKAHLAWIRGAVALVFLLGLTWALGLLYISKRTVAIAYAFTILNSLQGLFIFFFHCVHNSKARAEVSRRVSAWWRRTCFSSGDDDSFSLGSGGSATTAARLTAAAAGRAAVKNSYLANSSSNSQPLTHTSQLSGDSTSDRHTSATQQQYIASVWSQQGQSWSRRPPISACGSVRGSLRTCRPLAGGQQATGAAAVTASVMRDRKTCSLRSASRSAVPVAAYGSQCVTSVSPCGHMSRPPGCGTVAMHSLNDSLVRHPDFFVVYNQQQQRCCGHYSVDGSEPVYEEIDRDLASHHQHLQHLHHLQQQQQQRLLQHQQHLARVDVGGEAVCEDDLLRQSDISRQSSRSYGDSRPLIPYAGSTAAAPLCESNLRHFDRHQVLADLQQLEQLSPHLLASVSSSTSTATPAVSATVLTGGQRSWSEQSAHAV